MSTDQFELNLLKSKYYVQIWTYNTCAKTSLKIHDISLHFETEKLHMENTLNIIYRYQISGWGERRKGYFTMA